MIYIFDACAMIAYLRGEAGVDTVRAILDNPANRCFAHAINLCEVYYDFIRGSDVERARQAMRDLGAVGIRTRRDMNNSFWMAVGKLKGEIRKISLADCFAVELSRRLNGEVITSDHREFDPLAATGVCRVRFIR